MALPPIHPDIEALAQLLLGTWSGTGQGEYPTIEPFPYEETITFAHIGKPFLVYTQRTKHGADGRPLHAETGYWRSPPTTPGQVEVVLAHPTGVAEILEGTHDHNTDMTTGVIVLRSAHVTSTTTAKPVTAIERRFEIAGDTIRYTLAMAAVDEPLTHHLRAELHRTEPP